MLQLMYNEHTCDYATSPHLDHPLWDTFATSFNYENTIRMAISVPLLKCYCSIML